MSPWPVVDTNVIAYLVLQTPGFREEVAAFWGQVHVALAPAHWQAEIAQVIWLSARARAFDAQTAEKKLRLAGELPIQSEAVAPLQSAALQRSLQTGVAVYDTLFVELAAQRGCPLVTYDAQVLRAFPNIACRPSALM